MSGRFTFVAVLGVLIGEAVLVGDTGGNDPSRAGATDSQITLNTSAPIRIGMTKQEARLLLGEPIEQSVRFIPYIGNGDPGSLEKELYYFPKARLYLGFDDKARVNTILERLNGKVR
jgi:hypothetical protein